MKSKNHKYKIQFFIFINLWMFSAISKAQIPENLQKKVDSLNREIKNSKHDTLLIKNLFDLDNIIYAFDPVQDEEINNRIKDICKNRIKNKPKNKKLLKVYKNNLVKAWNNLGIIYMYNGRNDEALKAYQNAVKLSLEEKDVESASKSYVNMGILKYRAGDLATAIEYYSKGLKEMEKANNKEGMTSTLNNLAMIYRETGDTLLAIEYYEKSIKMSREINATQKTATALMGLSDIIKHQGNKKKALKMLNESLELYKKTEDVQGIASASLNLGKEFMVDGKIKEAEASFRMALSLGKKFRDPRTIGSSYASLANLGLQIKSNTMAFAYADSAFSILKESGLLRESLDPARILYFVKKEQDPKYALKKLEEYINIKESVDKESNQRAVIQQQYQYEYEKKTAKDSVKIAGEKKITDAEMEQQKAITAQQETEKIYLFIGIFLLMIFLGFIYNRFRVTSKQKNIIQSQKATVELAHHQLEEKNKEVLDSINYAKRIQTAILPSEKLMRNYFKNYFILYKPKDIVAGDFYWYEELEDYVMLAVADCTGHGVPGALVSVVCHGALNRSVREFSLRDAGKILDKAREIIIDEFSKSEEDVKDGMDISLIVINKKRNELNWAGANNPFWYIKKGSMFEIKADKQPIGKTYQPSPFTSHVLSMDFDNFFLFTDGYADQFGGPKGKKFKYSNLQKLLLENSNQDLNQQSQILNLEFDKWKGDLEQVDDVCIIGIRI